MQKDSDKKQNYLEERETISETEIDEISEEIEIDEVDKGKKIEERKVVVSGKKSSQSIFSDKTVTLLKGKLGKQYGIDHRKEKRVT